MSYGIKKVTLNLQNESLMKSIRQKKKIFGFRNINKSCLYRQLLSLLTYCFRISIWTLLTGHSFIFSRNILFIQHE